MEAGYPSQLLIVSYKGHPQPEASPVWGLVSILIEEP